MLPDVEAEWLALLLCILETQSSNIIAETGYPDKTFCGFPQSLQANSVQYFELERYCFLTYPFQPVFLFVGANKKNPLGEGPH
jgi:hypothetical protein